MTPPRLADFFTPSLIRYTLPMSSAEDYHIDRELKPGVTFLATDSAQRRVVLKRLPEDCLSRQQLHPSVKLRLQRLRELPMSSFVNVIGVERLPQGVMLVSEYADGVSFDLTTPDERPRLLRELRLAVMAMHQLGMVHGALHANNIIVGACGQVCLIDPSPLLHDDPAVDLAALDRLAPAAPATALDPAVPVKPDEPQNLRQRTLIAAVALVLFAVVAAIAAATYFNRN